MNRTFKKVLPKVSDLTKKYKSLQIFGNTILHPDLWHFDRYCIARGMAVGLFWCFIPVPFQMIIAVVTAVFLRANLPLAMMLCWISNPLTMAPLYYFNYRIGVMVLGDTVLEYSVIAGIRSIADFIYILKDLWLPVYLGSLLISVLFSICGYMLTIIAWRFAIIYRWNNRNNRCQRRKKGF